MPEDTKAPQTTTDAPKTTKATDPAKAATRPPPPLPFPPPSKMTAEDAILERARRGDRTVYPKLDAVLNEHPDLWQETGDLNRRTEDVWIHHVAGNDLLHCESLRRKIEQLRTDLAEANANALEKAMIDRIVCCWLAVQHAELRSALGENPVPVSLLYLKRLDAANHRFLQACKSLAQVRRLTAGLKIEITHRAEQTPRQAVKDVVAERVREENLVTA